MPFSEQERKTFLGAEKEEIFRVHKDLCLIPAPSHFERKRAEYCRDLLLGIGAEGTYIDEVGNVLFPLNCEGSREITVVNAHTDTVFPMETPLNFTDDGEYLRCPGVGDDTACLTVMLFVIKFFLEKGWKPKGGILFVCNVCEEGLGNLLGIRQVCKDFSGRIKRHISIDGEIYEIANRCVGSHRYNVTVKTEGGHSYSRFGNKNAIAEASKIISKIYELQVPEKTGEITTYNVGTITGGTSVNTIAQEVSFLCEYRSTDTDCLDIMQKRFADIFEAARSEKVEVTVDPVGERPCAKGVDENEIARLTGLYAETVESVYGERPVEDSSSTDCNVPLSLGIPAVCIGGMINGGTHTTEEWLKKDSLLTGFEVVADFLAKLG